MLIDDALQAKVITIAQILLRDESEETKRSPSAIAETVRLAALTAKVAPDQYDEAAAVAELVRRFSQWVPNDSALSDPTGHDDWLTAARKRDWRYWHRLQRYLERSLPVDVVEALDKSTDGIIAQLEDPTKKGQWDRRGLVVGHVQSGKTSSYSALICKAADAGYKIIVVLAGMHNNLRSQTQIRLEEAFLGYETSPNRDPGSPLGVFFEDRDPSIHPHCATTREDNGDFNTAAAKRFSISPEERPWLFVVKKNKTVLGRLLKWMQSNHVSDGVDPTSGRKMVNKLPLLVIDDEADNASVDTGEQEFVDGVADPDHEPKAINSLIRKILNTFSPRDALRQRLHPSRGENDRRGGRPFPAVLHSQPGRTIKLCRPGSCVRLAQPRRRKNRRPASDPRNPGPHRRRRSGLDARQAQKRPCATARRRG